MCDFKDIVNLCRSLNPSESRRIENFGANQDIRLTIHKDCEFEMVSMTAVSSAGRCWTTDIAIEEPEMEETLDAIYNGKFSDINKRYWGNDE